MKSRKLVMCILLAIGLTFGLTTAPVYASETMIPPVETTNSISTISNNDTYLDENQDKADITTNTYDNSIVNIEQKEDNIATINEDTTLPTNNVAEDVVVNNENNVVAEQEKIANSDEENKTDKEEIDSTENEDDAASNTDETKEVEAGEKENEEITKAEEADDTDDTEVDEDDVDKEDKDVEKTAKKNKEKEKTKKEIKEEANYTKAELRLLACLIYAEAGNQSYKGKVAVANVVLNRVKSKEFYYVDTIKEVIYDSKWGIQFSVTKKNSKGISPLSRALSMYDSKKYPTSAEKKSMSQCIKAAKAALNGENNIGDYLYFNRNSSYLSNKYSDHTVLGAHLFYNR